jgi:hypothetical protein
MEEIAECQIWKKKRHHTKDQKEQKCQEWRAHRGRGKISDFHDFSESQRKKTEMSFRNHPEEKRREEIENSSTKRERERERERESHLSKEISSSPHGNNGVTRSRIPIQIFHTLPKKKTSIESNILLSLSLSFSLSLSLSLFSPSSLLSLGYLAEGKVLRVLLESGVKSASGFIVVTGRMIHLAHAEVPIAFRRP